MTAEDVQKWFQGLREGLELNNEEEDHNFDGIDSGLPPSVYNGLQVLFFFVFDVF